MKRLRLPAKYRGMSLHIWCFKCKKAVTAKPCKHGEQQRFQSRIYNPLTKTVNCIKSYESIDIEEVVTLHRAYHAELKANNYFIPVYKTKVETTTKSIILLKDGAKKYLDYLQDIDVPSYEKKNLTTQYIKDQERYLTRFLKTVQNREQRITSFPANALSKDHVTAFDEFVRSLEFSQASYNAHFKSIKYFINYLIDELGVEMKNPFDKVKIPQVHYDPEIIPADEFEKLLSVITPENGAGIKGSIKRSVNYYRDWLKKVFAFALLTGERLDGIVLLRWSHVEGNFLKIPNFKVNRIKKVESYYSYTPITADLAELLAEFKMASPDDYIVVPEYTSRINLKKFISKAFTHYWRVTGIRRQVSFKTLRKTYLTRLTSLIGEKAMFVKHNEDKTAIKHYLKKTELLEQTKDVRLYDISLWFS